MAAIEGTASFFGLANWLGPENAGPDTQQLWAAFMRGS